MFENKSIKQTCSQLNVNPAIGLSVSEIALRQSNYGKNELPKAKQKSLLAAFLSQLQDPLIYVLLISAAISFLLHEASDAFIILFVVLSNAAIGLIQEGKAQKALDSLKRLTSPHAIARREGHTISLPASELVPGDIVLLEAGCRVPADLRLIEAENLKAEESSLTGESLPVEKNSQYIAPFPDEELSQKLPLGDRKNMVYMSTVITYGRGKGIVTATGLQTEIGKIASLINEATPEITPLQKRLGELGIWLSSLSLLLCALLFLVGLYQHRNLFEMLLTAISLAVAAVPEGLPAVVTICLALSVTRMVKANSIIRRLPAVETLGAVNVVCSDKTGTLTQNQMKVLSCYYNNQLYSRKELPVTNPTELIKAMVLCNDASVTNVARIGDPTELALLDLASDLDIDFDIIRKKNPRIRELPFDSNRKMMTTQHRTNGKCLCYSKGAPDEILSKCTSYYCNGKNSTISSEFIRNIQNQVHSMSIQALRVLAFAMHNGNELCEANLTFLGLVGMLDPERPEAIDAVKSFQSAGVRTVMITGDHVDTAFTIAKKLGIAQDFTQCMTGTELSQISPTDFRSKLPSLRVFARISPEQKVKIVKGFQELNHIVAMTGDGVNDAPALKAADIGISMGKNGTDVAKQASDIILTDDNFATIEKAISEGRSVYENIKKSVIFLLSSNLGEIITMFSAVCCGFASPLKSSHILWINLITDSLPALALGIDPNDHDSLMKKQPRAKKESLFAAGGLTTTCFYGFLIAVISLTAFFSYPYILSIRQNLPFHPASMICLLQNSNVLARSQTYTFTVLGISQLFHAIGMRDIHKSVFRMKHTSNPLILLALLSGIGLQVMVTEIPFFIHAFGTVHLFTSEWLYLIILSAFPLLGHELLSLFHQIPE